MLKIATWNIERLRHKNELPSIVASCEQANADIFILTETDSRLNLKYKSCFSALPEATPNYYAATETRVSIYTNYDFVRRYTTFDEHTAISVELETDIGSLLVYGTVIGIYGNRHKNYMNDLLCQIADIKSLAAESKRLCICGDYNCSFSDNYYFTKAGRTALEEAFSKYKLELLTRNQSECIDHIVVSRELIDDSLVEITEWNLDKKLSDHKGIAVEII
ncbi:MAG: endonuclease/exonuclease/phosphatase family protein [Clostridiales Family XIII bacterium]|nr:endonuclease/exonuclease/phosphatase family protein [Clostridiales Family XIII bacterium]